LKQKYHIDSKTKKVFDVTQRKVVTFQKIYWWINLPWQIFVF
jgi:hypothetical protein